VRADRRGTHRPHPQVQRHQLELEVGQDAGVDQHRGDVLVRQPSHPRNANPDLGRPWRPADNDAMTATATSPLTGGLTLGNVRAETPVVLAPMAGITNAAYRRLCAEQG